jgi:hypothetical protein
LAISRALANARVVMRDMRQRLTYPSTVDIS